MLLGFLILKHFLRFEQPLHASWAPRSEDSEREWLQWLTWFLAYAI